MLLKAQNIKKEYGIQEILEIDTLQIEDFDRIGLVGKNGAGKSTLMSILAGDLEPDEGYVKRFCPIARIRQSQEAKGPVQGSYISRLGLKDSAVKSGGERTRLAIGAAFSQNAPLLMADEPTTNLDLEGILLLEKMMAGFRGAILLISHDRALLDRICTTIWELEDGKLRVFEGNYSQWTAQKERERNFEQFQYDQYQKEKKRLTQNIRDFREQSRQMIKPPKQMSSSEWMLYKGGAAVRQGHVQARTRATLSRLEHLEKRERPAQLPEVSMKLPDSKKIRARYAISVRDLTIQYGEKTVFQKLNFFLPSGTRTVIAGPNGSGKSSLIRAILDRVPGVSITSEASIAYLSQDQDTLNPKKTVLENVLEDAAFPEHICRAVLDNLCMSPLDIKKPVFLLSGGERVKTALAKVLVSGCNLLILDEPTNHIDVYTMAGLEHLLSSYDGTLLAVSHDRAFIEHVADQVYVMKDGRLAPEG
ncbi:MAG: ABC-F type ribosomal protection protein [Lachnospiraceae bacterium]|nr:ABC-F type ribosomal protection protein [Lachnospiraceae bacterium]